jgi:phosphoglycerate kinase
MNNNLTSIRDLDIYKKKLLIRVDFNVPQDSDLNITDDTRIRAVLPTINYALDERAKIILCSHKARPGGKRVESMSLEPVARRLARLLHKKVTLAPDCIGPEVEKLCSEMKSGEVVLLENLRFHPGETGNDVEFARQLASLADIYINDAFAVAHRDHASVTTVAKFAKQSAAGFLLMNEINYFKQALDNPARPLVAVQGGSKVRSKLGALENLLVNVDKMIIGGAMANTFLKSVGYEIGKSMYEPELIDTCNCLLRRAKDLGVKMYIPVDCVVADHIDKSAETKVCPAAEIPNDWYIMDIGPATSMLYGEALSNAKTIVWNGPMGAFEIDAFSRGTMAMVRQVADTYALTIVGGGDTDVAVHKAGESEKISYISTGGGAFITLLEGSELPGVLALQGRFDEIGAPKRKRDCEPPD